MNRAEREGRQAALDGWTESANPYDPGEEGVDYDRWLDGYYLPPVKLARNKHRNFDE